MKEKVMNFCKEHWDGIIIVGAVCTAEYALCRIYKNYLNKLLEE